MTVFYRPPADIDDFSGSSHGDELRQAWHDYIASAVARRDEHLFYDAANDPTPGTTPARLPIPWNGFPRSIWQWFNAESDPNGAAAAFAAADVLRPFTYVALGDENGDYGLARQFPAATIPSMRVLVNGTLGATIPPLFYRQQDEYCEWHADRVNGKITRISFTAEGPEYWQEMARIDRTLVTTLYQSLVDASVVEADLFWATDVAVPFFDVNNVFQGYGLGIRAGQYNPNNKWNTTHGAVHLTHPANTLGAEINLGADATVQFPSIPEAPANTFASRLICCAGYGGVNRSSDPSIGAAVNGLARSGNAVTLENPVGLYIRSVELSGLADPSGNAVAGALDVRRASPDGEKILRVEVRPPAGAAYTLDECTLDLEPLAFGGQIARKITMSLFGLAKVIPGRSAESDTCQGKCCSRPASPSFAALVAQATNCSNLTEEQWMQFGPYTGDSSSNELLAAANAVAPLESVQEPYLMESAPNQVSPPPATRNL